MGNSNKKTAFVLVHGSFHGSWCWDLVEKYLNNAGYATIAIDLPGQGLNALVPDSFKTRPLDLEAFAIEPSKLAAIPAKDYGDAVIDGVNRARAIGAERIIAVGHSAGGVPVNFAAGAAPEKFDGLVYLAGIAPLPGKPSGAFLQLEDQHANGKLLDALMADPAIVGAFRMDSRSPDPDYMAAVKNAMAADVDDELWVRAMHLMTPDASAGIHGEVPEFKEGFAMLERTFICCTQDKTLVPSTCKAIVDEMNVAWPESPTRLVELEASHEAMFSQPKMLADLLIDAAK